MRRSDRSLLRSRAAMATGIVGLVAVALAARQPAAPAQPPAATPAPVAAPADSQKPKADSTAMPMDSAAMAGMSGMAGMAGMNHMQMAAPAPQAHAAPGTWPVDPTTGQTLINGVPVVGRVFIMQKTDGTVKIANVAAALHGEPGAPEAATVKHEYAPAKSINTRRVRGIMVQATLWDLDQKKSVKRSRYY